MLYCAEDVRATFEVAKRLYPLFLERQVKFHLLLNFIF